MENDKKTGGGGGGGSQNLFLQLFTLLDITGCSYKISDPYDHSFLCFYGGRKKKKKNKKNLLVLSVTLPGWSNIQSFYLNEVETLHHYTHFTKYPTFQHFDRTSCFILFKGGGGFNLGLKKLCYKKNIY